MTVRKTATKVETPASTQDQDMGKLGPVDTGPPQRWWHWQRGSTLVALCGWTHPNATWIAGGKAPGRECPDCARIKWGGR